MRSELVLVLGSLTSCLAAVTNLGPDGWTLLGCYTDSTSARSLRYAQSISAGSDAMTVAECTKACKAAEFSFAGVEYARECFCDNSIQNGGTDGSGCDMTCTGNSTEYCGGPDRLNLYQAMASLTRRSSPATSTTTQISSSTTSSVRPASSLRPSSSSTPTSSIQATSRSSATTVSSTTSASPSSTACPDFWSAVVQDLAAGMRTNGQCNNISRAAIRYAFHDSAGYSIKTPFYAPAAGGADGSLLLSPTEIDRPDQDGLRDFHAFLKSKFTSYMQSGYAIGAADLIQVAGATGVLACPGGRIGRVYVGRADTRQEAPDGLLPQAFGAGSDHNTIMKLFADKGFAPRDLAALLGAHSTSIANFQAKFGIPAGTPQDTTPGTWDVKYYNETYFPPAGIGRFASDINLSKNQSREAVGYQFQSFVGRPAQWGASFASAFQTLSLLGIPTSVRRNMQDCTSVVFSAFP